MQAIDSVAAREDTVARLCAEGAVAVIRMRSADVALRAIRALHDGGVSALEITLTTPGALGLIERTSRELGDAVLVGVGSVLDARSARRAVEAGARYVVSPVFNPEVVEEAHRQGVPAIPGAFTPTEILRAHEAGADLVKVFPADTLGPAFLKGVLGPMPFLRLIPTGGVTPYNVGDWLHAGAVAVGLGSALADPKLAEAGDFAALTDRARTVSRGVAMARAGLAGADR
jgi:2-dehydro-3-deoxyphosphogluconate aldolase/(4S)-4-hydroxy-2-oxoglutarate aldolase